MAVQWLQLLCACMFVYMFVNMFVCMCGCICMHVCVYVCVCLCVCVYEHDGLFLPLKDMAEGYEWFPMEKRSEEQTVDFSHGEQDARSNQIRRLLCQTIVFFSAPNRTKCQEGGDRVLSIAEPSL